MATSNNDRISSSRLNTFATELWSKIKNTFATLTHYHSASEITSGKFADSMIESASTWNGKLDTAGGTMTGNIGFSSIGTWPTPEGETYPIISKGLHWSGSSDTADIYYSVEASDKGRLNIDMGDDSNADIAFRFGNSSSKRVYTIDYNGNFSGNSATVNGHSVNSDVPANAKFTDTNTWRPVVDNLESSSSTDCLSANQGRILDIHDNVSVYFLRGSTYWGNSVTENDMFPLATLTQSGGGNWGIYDRFFMRVSSTCWVRFAIVVNGTRNSISTKSVLVEESRGVSDSEILVTYKVVGNSSEGGASVKIYWKNANKRTWSKAFLWRIPSSSGDAGYYSYNVWTILDGNRITSLPEGEIACSVASSNATYRGNAETATTATNYSATGGIATALEGKQNTLPIENSIYQIGVLSSLNSGNAIEANKSHCDGGGNNIMGSYGASIDIVNTNVLQLINMNGEVISTKTLPYTAVVFNLTGSAGNVLYCL